MKKSPQRIVIGIGSGRCGTLTLTNILNQQLACKVTHERRPLLPWSSDKVAAIVQARIANFCSNNEPIVGDVGSFYLPYIQEFIRQFPDIRVVVLKRDCEEVVKSFCNWSDHAHRVPADHWSQEPAPGLYHHPIWSTIFPKYPSESRADSIRKYWTEYYQRTDELQQQFPQQVHIFDMDEALNTAAGQTRLLSFVGIPVRDQVMHVGMHLHRSIRVTPSDDSLNRIPEIDAHDSSQCVILVPHGGSIVPGCEDSLKVLEERGYEVRRVGGYAQIDTARNELATAAMLDKFQETIWIDSDIGFHPDAVEKLRSHKLPIVCGVYAKKGKRELAINVLPGTKQLNFGEQGGLHEIQYAATGFLLVRRQVYLDIQFRLDLPLCNELFGANVVPYFLPMVRRVDDGHRYLGEDYAFCERARNSGHCIMADTTIRLWHIGNYAYGWEDAGRDIVRFDTYTYNFTD